MNSIVLHKPFKICRSAQPGERGVTLLEMLITIGLIFILSAIAVSNLRVTANPLASAGVSTEQFLQLARARAIAGTEVIRVTPSSAAKLQAFRGKTCDESTTAVSDMLLDLPHEVSVQDTEWAICFNARGRADANVVFGLTDRTTGTKTVRIALGGGIKIE